MESISSQQNQVTKVTHSPILMAVVYKKNKTFFCVERDVLKRNSSIVLMLTSLTEKTAFQQHYSSNMSLLFYICTITKFQNIHGFCGQLPEFHKCLLIQEAMGLKNTSKNDDEKIHFAYMSQSLKSKIPHARSIRQFSFSL